MIAQDMLERMRANPQYLYRYINNGAGRTVTATQTYPPTGGNDCEAVDCVPSRIAGYDYMLLRGQLRGAAETTESGTVSVGGLSQAIACIRFVGSGAAVGPPAPPEFPSYTSVAGEYEVTIAWRGMTRLSAPTNTCGNTSTYYSNFDDPTQTAGNNAYRRVLSVRTYIDAAPPAGAIAVPGT